MSGLGNFGLSSLGSMSTLGSLAQSAQRLDRLMAGNRSRQEGSEYGRNNSRRSMDNDFFGRRSDRSRRRSPSPPRVSIKVEFSSQHAVKTTLSQILYTAVCINCSLKLIYFSKCKIC